MASPVNQHCVNCIGTVSFPIQKKIVSAVVQYGQNVRWSHRLSVNFATAVTAVVGHTPELCLGMR